MVTLVITSSFNILFTTSIPEATYPKIVCLLFSHSVVAIVIKNCDPFVFGPELAIAKIPTLSNLASVNSSLNAYPGPP